MSMLSLHGYMISSHSLDDTIIFLYRIVTVGDGKLPIKKFCVSKKLMSKLGAIDESIMDVRVAIWRIIEW